MGVSIVVSMGNAQARKRIKARDFEYLAKNTRFATIELVEEYFDMVMDKYPDGRMEEEDFKNVWHCFPCKTRGESSRACEENCQQRWEDIPGQHAGPLLSVLRWEVGRQSCWNFQPL